MVIRTKRLILFRIPNLHLIDRWISGRFDGPGPDLDLSLYRLDVFRSRFGHMARRGVSWGLVWSLEEIKTAIMIETMGRQDGWEWVRSLKRRAV